MTSLWGLSKVVKNNLNPSWEPFRLSLHSLCSCDVHRPLKVKPCHQGQLTGALGLCLRPSP